MNAVHQGLLALEIAGIVFQALPWFQFHHEEMVIILLKLSLRSILVVGDISYIFKEGALQERIEPMISSSLEDGENA